MSTLNMVESGIQTDSTLNGTSFNEVQINSVSFMSTEGVPSSKKGKQSNKSLVSSCRNLPTGEGTLAFNQAGDQIVIFKSNFNHRNQFSKHGGLVSIKLDDSSNLFSEQQHQSCLVTRETFMALSVSNEPAGQKSTFPSKSSSNLNQHFKQEFFLTQQMKVSQVTPTTTTFKSKSSPVKVKDSVIGTTE